MSPRCALLVTLAVLIVLTVDAYPREDSLEDIFKQNVETGKREAVNYSGNSERFSEHVNKPTRPPLVLRSTKKPGTYIQSIWDIYIPEHSTP